MTRLQGHVDPRFQPVADTFKENFERRGEVGASVCVYYRGEKVVDLWGGVADKSSGAPWQEDTVSVVFSSTKGLAAACGLVLADRGLLDYDAPVARYWPEFGAGGKDAITVRTLLNHRAGLHAVDAPITLEDFEQNRVAEIVADQVPAWEPGSAQGYHGVTFGMFVPELFRRIAGRSVGSFLRSEISDPLGVAAYIGIPDEAVDKLAALYPTSGYDRLFKMVPRLIGARSENGRVYRAIVRKKTPTAKAFAKPSSLSMRGIWRFGTPEILKLELPWANGVANGRSLATIYAALIGVGPSERGPLVSTETIKPVMDRQSWSERDRVLLKPMGFSQGFIKEQPHLFSPNIESFGHPGAGGALGYADPVAGVAIGYVMNRMDFRIRSPRALALCHALYSCLPLSESA